MRAGSSFCHPVAPSPLKKPRNPRAPAEPVGAQYAFHQVFLTARTWAPDFASLTCSGCTDGQPQEGEGGKRAAWEVICRFPCRSGKSRTFTYSVVEEGNIHKGVFPAGEEDYSGPRGQTRPWPVQAFRTDSTAAYETALKQEHRVREEES